MKYSFSCTFADEPHAQVYSDYLIYCFAKHPRDLFLPFRPKKADLHPASTAMSAQVYSASETFSFQVRWRTRNSVCYLWQCETASDLRAREIRNLLIVPVQNTHGVRGAHPGVLTARAYLILVIRCRERAWTMRWLDTKRSESVCRGFIAHEAHERPDLIGIPSTESTRRKDASCLRTVYVSSVNGTHCEQQIDNCCTKKKQFVSRNVKLSVLVIYYVQSATGQLNALTRQHIVL